MKPMFLVLLLSIILINQCDNNLPIVGQKKKQNSSKELRNNMAFVCFVGRFTMYRENRIIDNKDGTVSLAEVTVQGTDYCPLPGGKTETVRVKYYIKKCIQGQVYRQAENDCKGTGTAANYYGAQKYQWCAAGSGCNENSRPAQVTCIQDKFNNFSWNNLDYYNSNSLSRQDFVNLIASFSKQQSLEIPTQSSDYYWLSGSAFNILGDYDNFKFSQAEFLYVRCSKGV